jgi:hypothetical protein
MDGRLPSSRTFYNIRGEEKKTIANINIYQSIINGLPPMVSAAVFGTREALGSIEPSSRRRLFEIHLTPRLTLWEWWQLMLPKSPKQA